MGQYRKQQCWWLIEDEGGASCDAQKFMVVCGVCFFMEEMQGKESLWRWVRYHAKDTRSTCFFFIIVCMVRH